MGNRKERKAERGQGKRDGERGEEGEGIGWERREGRGNSGEGLWRGGEREWEWRGRGRRERERERESDREKKNSPVPTSQA